jgi:hypothetical protein
MRKDLLKAVALVSNGATYDEAATRLGLTRCSVAGACSRAGLMTGRNHQHTPKTREKMRCTHLAIRADPKRDARRLAAQRSPATRKKQSQARLAWWRRRREQLALI